MIDLFGSDKIEVIPFPVVSKYCFQTVQGASFIVHLAFEALVGFF